MDKDGTQYVVQVVLALGLIIVILYLSGCASVHDKYYVNPIDKPYITHDGETQCVAIPFGKSIIDKDRDGRYIYDYNGTLLFRCGMTPAEAADYQHKLEYALDYKP